ncbi:MULTISPECIES: hypothetical protein [unclassified Meiothermus]|uniref:hypothetical protein n=1 Tax=unclassified Meiothermus TaxID=370471 RepID=UPI000D7C96AB|nr:MULTISPECIES: hypothetical protein [unclassified Meiothermus]PZA06995.1 hypothetical protein DNA98_10050 [Meiothermus sp. Pnk-1]RYM35303.1 hypothetical protein EWH23_11870 [Meiothermus sp. PNK-Is4]
MTRVLTVLVLALTLASCRYTFLPLVPERVAFPDRPSLYGTLEPSEREIVAKLEVRRMPRPGYIELKWYKEETLLAERSLWVEGPGKFEVRLPLATPPPESTGAAAPQNPTAPEKPALENYYRLVVILEGSAVLQLDTGTPSLPTDPNPPSAP